MYDRGLATRSHELTATLLDLESAGKLVEGDPHAHLFDLNGKTMKGWVMIAADALGEAEDLPNHIYTPMSFTCTLPPKNRKIDIETKCGVALINSA